MKINTKRAMIATVAMISIGCGGGGTTPSVEYHAYDAPAIDENLKQEYLKAVNDARAIGRECGKYGYMPAVPPLQWSDELYRAAYEHSEDMSTSGHYAHSGSGTDSDWTSQVLELGRGSKIEERIRNNGYYFDPKGWSGGENAANGQETIDEVMNAWLESEGHCHNIMNASFKDVGMAEVDTTRAVIYKAYWTQNFGGK